jgi:hypothetical protein
LIEMAIYTVHEPPLRRGATTAEPDRVRFVRDGFYFWAFLLAPFWMLWRRLWLVAFLYIVAMALVHTGFWYFRLNETAQFVIDMGIALLVGLEASTLQRWTLARRGWKEVATVVGDDLESAERRYFTARTEPQQKPEPAKPAMVSTWGPRNAGNDVVGLFPEPGGPR